MVWKKCIYFNTICFVFSPYLQKGQHLISVDLRTFATFWKCIVLTKWREQVMEENIINREGKKWNGLVCRDWNIQPVVSKAELCRPPSLALSLTPGWSTSRSLASMGNTVWSSISQTLPPQWLDSLRVKSKWVELQRTRDALAGLSKEHKGGRTRILPSGPAHRDQPHDKGALGKHWLCGTITSPLAVQRREVRGAGTGMAQGTPTMHNAPRTKKERARHL